MALVNLKECIGKASAQRYAIGCFNIINTESLQGILRAAEKKRSPVCLTIHPPHFKNIDLETFICSVKAAANKATVPVVLHLDNAEEIEQIVSAVRYGFTSLMYIGKKEMGAHEKIEKTKLVAEIAHFAGLLIESDTPYDSDEENYIANMIDFVNRTDIDIISANIIRKENAGQGTAVDIDFDLLRKIKQHTGKFVSLHGGSGVPDDSLRKAISIGLDKMHIYGKAADLSIKNIKKYLEKDSGDVLELLNKIDTSFMQIVETNIDLFGSAQKSDFSGHRNDHEIQSTDSERLAEIITKVIVEKMGHQ
jgi:fructose-bisphosphate aldolase, class II